MSYYYIYLLSSLPALAFGSKPPMAFEKFLGLCRGLIPDKEIGILNDLARADSLGFFYEGGQTTLKNWYGFETMLRNELVRIRASRKKIDPGRYFRRESYAEPWITHLAHAAHRSVSLLEGERILDEARWRYLDELLIGHYFDLDCLIVYAQKLLILERWESIRAQDKHKLLEEMLVQ